MKKGTSLVELLLYCGLIVIILTVLYQFFAVIAFQRIEATADEAVFGSGRRILFEISQSIKGAASVDSPAIGDFGQLLSLNGGAVLFQVNENGRLEKAVSGETLFISDSNVIIENINFTTLGPSTAAPTVEVSFTIRYAHLLEGGRERTEDFKTSVTMRS